MVISENHWLDAGDDVVEVTESDLLHDFRMVVGSVGVDLFLRAPILEPSSKFFPDQWVPNEEGVRVVTQRLLNYAGLGFLVANVIVHESGEADQTKEEGGASSHEGALGLFFGIDGESVKFGCDSGIINDPESLIGTMGHEVAHAYRSYHKLQVEDRIAEEVLTDMTTICLGFGLFSCNSSRIYEKSSELIGINTVTKESIRRAGYLPPYIFASLFAIQAVCRDMQRKQVSQLVHNLRGCHRDYFKESYAQWKRRREELVTALGVQQEDIHDFSLPKFSADDVLAVRAESHGSGAVQQSEKPHPQCKNCGGKIDYVVEECPHCNTQLSFGKPSIGLWVAVIITITIILWHIWPF